MKSEELDKLLAALREDTRAVEAPGRVEASLLQALRAQAKAAPATRRAGWTHWALAAAAAVIVVLGAGVWMVERPVPEIGRVTLPVAAPPEFVQPVASKPVVMAAVKRPKRTVPRSVEPMKREPPAPVREIATDFLPLEDAMSLPPIESGHIMRVEMPRSNMIRFGFPVNPDRMMEPVKADVVFGQDGIARAVRFVR